MLQLHPNRRSENSSSVIPRLHPCESRTAKGKSTMTSQGNLWKDVLLYVHLTTAVLRICTASRQTTPVTTKNAERAAVSAKEGISENRPVNTGS
jgi:hypothetical protein